MQFFPTRHLISIPNPGKRTRIIESKKNVIFSLLSSWFKPPIPVSDQEKELREQLESNSPVPTPEFSYS